MHRGRRRVFQGLTGALVTVALGLSLGPAGVASADESAAPYTFAVIGDVPYGSAQFAAFPHQIDVINAAPDVSLVAHVGDISNPLNCSDSYYSTIKARFDSFTDPFVYTPGDNEWADCGRAAIGAGNALTRLAAVRRVFYPTPGLTLGQNAIGVTAQSGYPENGLFDQGQVTFAALHVVGSYNDLAIWKGQSGVTSAQRAEVDARTNAVITLVHDAFAQAAANGNNALVLLMQANMFSSGSAGSSKYKSAYSPIVKAIAAESLAYAGSVILINGDTHAFVNDKPLTRSSWMGYYGISSPVTTLSRITVRYGTYEYTRFTVFPDTGSFTVARVAVS